MNSPATDASFAYPILSRVGFLCVMLIMVPGFWLLFTVIDDPGTLMHDQMPASTIVLGLPLWGLGIYPGYPRQILPSCWEPVDGDF